MQSDYLSYVLFQKSSPAGESRKKAYQVPIDWTLRTKVRFMSPKPFPFNGTLRTCEEASGITGYGRNLSLYPSTTSSALYMW